jgi:transposase
VEIRNPGLPLEKEAKTMSLNQQEKMSIPDETVQVAKASFPKGTALVRLRDEIGPLFRDEDFHDIYSWKGAEGISPALLGIVTVLQYAEGLSDRQAAEAVRSRIDWKYLMGVEITYAGFDFSILSEFRNRLIREEVSERLFEKPLAQLKSVGLVRERGRQRSDSTHVLAAIRTLNRLELVGETLRQALNHTAVDAPDWLKSWVPVEWFERYAERMEQSRFPKNKKKQEALMQHIGQDGFTFLEKIDESTTPERLCSLPAIQVLATVWEQQFIRIQDDQDDSPSQVAWRPTPELPPGAEMINSPYDPEARFSRKRKTTWTGCKVHLSESCDDHLPHLITHVETTPATEPDCQTLPVIHQGLADKGLLPAEHLVDGGYMDIDNFLDSRQQEITLVGPMRPDSSWQAREQTGYDIAHFVVDWSQQSVTCPEGKSSRFWSSSTNKDGVQSISVRFHPDDCAPCPKRLSCTRAASAPRAITLQTQERHQTLQRLRTSQLEKSFLQLYRSRAGVEGTISQATRAFELRRSRFIGHAKTKLQHLATAAALNLARLDHWLIRHPRSLTRLSPFAELTPSTLP